MELYNSNYQKAIDIIKRNKEHFISFCQVSALFLYRAFIFTQRINKEYIIHSIKKSYFWQRVPTIILCPHSFMKESPQVLAAWSDDYYNEYVTV